MNLLAQESGARGERYGRPEIAGGWFGWELDTDSDIVHQSPGAGKAPEPPEPQLRSGEHRWMLRQRRAIDCRGVYVQYLLTGEAECGIITLDVHYEGLRAGSFGPGEGRTMKCTLYFLHTRRRPDRAVIRDEWIERVIQHPQREEQQEDGRIRRWARILEMDNRALRVILLADGETVHNAFFDRDFKD